MGPNDSFLVAILSEGQLLWCALKMDDPPDHCNEPEGRAAISEALPLHVKNSGQIVEVMPLFCVHDARRRAVR